MLGKRILTEEEKLAVMDSWRYQCYICRGDIINPDEAEFVHMVPLDQGGTFALSNYVPLHNYCYRKAEDMDLHFARDEAEISTGFTPDFDSLFQVRRAEPAIHVDKERMVASVDDEAVRLYQCPNTGTCYFYHQIPASYLEADPQIHPLGLHRGRVVRLCGHLRDHIQLNPVVCHLENGRLKVVSGLHRAAAQYLGNHHLRVDCKVLVDADSAMIIQAEKVARGPLRSLGRKPAPLTDWLYQEFREEINGWLEVHPDQDLTEYLIFNSVLQQKQNATERLLETFFEHWLQNTETWKQGTARIKEAAVLLPEAGARLLIQAWGHNQPGQAVLESDLDFRQEEADNVLTILDIIWNEGLFTTEKKDCADPGILQTQLREEGISMWGRILTDALRIIVQRPPETGVVYGPRLNSLEKVRLTLAVRRLFSHPFWQDLELDRAFREHDHDYVEKARQKWTMSHQILLRG